ncbi:hypothetical protein B0H14DRAFT_2704492, partial [Mycena olivaceomarginata]
MKKERTREGRRRNGREEGEKRETEEGTDTMRTSHRRIRRPIPTPRRPATRPSTSVRDARMPARRGASCRSTALCCTCSPLPPPLLGDPSNSRSSRPGDLFVRFAPRAAFLMGSGGAPRDVRGADVVELRRPCVQRRAREEVVGAVLCAPALARLHRPRHHTPRAPKEIKPGAE